MEDIITYFVFVLPLTYMFLKWLLDVRRSNKIKSFAVCIIIYGFNIIFAPNNRADDLTLADCSMIIISMVLLYVYSFLLIIKSRDTFMKIGVMISWFAVSYIFSFSALKVEQMGLLYIFKTWSMLTLLMGLIALRDSPAWKQIIGGIILYVLMIGTDIIFSRQFYRALTENQFWKGIYETVQRSYCLNPINGEMQDMDIKMYIFDFFMCKIMDVTLLGFLSARFLDIVKESNSVSAYSIKLMQKANDYYKS